METKKTQELKNKLKEISAVHNLTPPAKKNYKEISDLKLFSEANGTTLLQSKKTGKVYAVLSTNELKELKQEIKN